MQKVVIGAEVHFTNSSLTGMRLKLVCVCVCACVCLENLNGAYSRTTCSYIHIHLYLGQLKPSSCPPWHLHWIF